MNKPYPTGTKHYYIVFEWLNDEPILICSTITSCTEKCAYLYHTNNGINVWHEDVCTTLEQAKQKLINKINKLQ